MPESHRRRAIRRPRRKPIADRSERSAMRSPESSANARDRNALLLPTAALIFAVDHPEIEIKYSR
jgi:hypothetical protein